MVRVGIQLWITKFPQPLRLLYYYTVIQRLVYSLKTHWLVDGWGPPGATSLPLSIMEEEEARRWASCSFSFFTSACSCLMLPCVSSLIMACWSPGGTQQQQTLQWCPITVTHPFQTRSWHGTVCYTPLPTKSKPKVIKTFSHKHKYIKQGSAVNR